MVSPGRRRACVEHVARELGVSERRACAALGQHRSTQRKAPRVPDDEARLTAEIVAKLRQVEVLAAQGKAVAEAVRSIGVTEQTYYRWRAEFGGLKLDQVKRLKELERENARLRKAVSDLTLEKVILKEAASGKW